MPSLNQVLGFLFLERGGGLDVCYLTPDRKEVFSLRDYVQKGIDGLLATSQEVDSLLRHLFPCPVYSKNIMQKVAYAL